MVNYLVLKDFFQKVGDTFDSVGESFSLVKSAISIASSSAKMQILQEQLDKDDLKEDNQIYRDEMKKLKKK